MTSENKPFEMIPVAITRAKHLDRGVGFHCRNQVSGFLGKRRRCSKC